MHTLEFCAIDCNNSDHIAECINLCGNLKNLSLDDLQYSEENLMNSILGMTNLESLTIKRMKRGINIVKKVFIDYISCNLVELKYLDLSSCSSITDRTLKSLGKLSKLEMLKISGIPLISGSELGPFPNLKELHCRDCCKLEINFFEKLLKHAIDLKYLDISGEMSINKNTVVKIAIKETKKRTNDVVLDLVVGYDKVDYDEINETSPLLHLKINDVGEENK